MKAEPPENGLRSGITSGDPLKRGRAAAEAAVLAAVTMPEKAKHTARTYIAFVRTIFSPQFWLADTESIPELVLSFPLRLSGYRIRSGPGSCQRAVARRQSTIGPQCVVWRGSP